MNNTNLTCVAATAGTSIGQEIWIEFCHYQLSTQNFIQHSWYIVYFHIHMHVVKTITFLQIAGSAVRLLTNIPHCCTVHIGVFSDPMWSINLSVLTTSQS